jgi:multisubunit Na+/H+ antiporter MnhF subunit
MNRWELAALVIIAGLVPCVVVAAVASAGAALAAVELAGVLTVTALMLLSEGFHRQPFVDLAVVMALVSTVGSLTFARMMERDP